MSGRLNLSPAESRGGHIPAWPDGARCIPACPACAWAKNVLAMARKAWKSTAASFPGVTVATPDFQTPATWRQMDWAERLLVLAMNRLDWNTAKSRWPSEHSGLLMDLHDRFRPARLPDEKLEQISNREEPRFVPLVRAHACDLPANLAALVTLEGRSEHLQRNLPKGMTGEARERQLVTLDAQMGDAGTWAIDAERRAMRWDRLLSKARVAA